MSAGNINITAEETDKETETRKRLCIPYEIIFLG